MQSALRWIGLSAVLSSSQSFQSGTAAFIMATSESSLASTRRLMSSTSSTEDQKVVRVLALHGSEGTAEEFPQRLKAIEEALIKEHNVKLEINAIEGPFPKGDGFSWWTMPPGVRSYTADDYGGFTESSLSVIEAWASDKPYDLCLGHSQGAIMLAALIALQKNPYHPSIGYIFNGVSFPNPYREEIKNLQVASDEGGGCPSILFIMGTNDKVTPNETGEELRNGFEQAGMSTELLKHPDGHAVPNKEGDIVNAIAQWITDRERNKAKPC